jgi:hypothetical protein
MKKFLRSIGPKSQKRRIVVDNGQEKEFNSLIEMSASDRAAYIINAMNSCDEDCMSPEQIAVARQCVKAMMIQQALAKNCR